jgi:hypothetical protein
VRDDEAGIASDGQICFQPLLAKARESRRRNDGFQPVLLRFFLSPMSPWDLTGADSLSVPVGQYVSDLHTVAYLTDNWKTSVI